MTEEPLPAWSLPAEAVERIALPEAWPGRITREWAWGDATGSGVRVCVLDSGVERDHPLVGEIQESIAISSVRVLGAGFTGSGAVLLEGLRWAVEQGYDVINMSLSTTKQKFATLLHELADSAYFRRTMLVASAHNMPVESYPWRFSSVISVGSHELSDPYTYYYNPTPPVEFFARGVDVEVPWLGGGRLVCTGNSFATPHVAGIAALILSKHRELTPFQLKSVLYLTASNVGNES
jgi:subtilisin